jgi:hypothetical protein
MKEILLTNLGSKPYLYLVMAAVDFWSEKAAFPHK